MIKLQLLFGFLVIFLGCSDNKADSRRFPTQPTENIPFKPLNQYCDTVEGTTYYPGLEYCACEDKNKYFVIKDSKGQCIENFQIDIPDSDLAVETPQEEDDEGGWFSFFAGSDDSDNNDQEDPPTPANYNYVDYYGMESSIGIASPSSIPNFSPALARVDKDYYKNLTYAVYIGANAEKQDLLIKSQFQYNPPRHGQHYDETFVFSNADKYKKAMRGGKLDPLNKTCSSNNRRNCLPTDTKEEIKVLSEAYNQLLENKKELKTYGNCSHFCYIDTLWDVIEHPNTEIHVSGYRSYGSSIRTRLVWRSKISKDIFASLQLTPSNKVASLVIVKNNEVRNLRIDTEFTTFEIPFEQPYFEKTETLVNLREARRQSQRSAKPYDSSQAHVLVCDTGNIGSSTNRHEVSFATGPEGNSLLGWLEQGSMAFNLKYDSVGSTFYNIYEEKSSHLHEVSSAMSRTFKNLERSDKALGIIPIQYRNCSENFSLLETNLKRTNVKVINASLTQLVHIDKCKELEIVKTINKTKKDFLWIFSAGNQERELNPRNKYCPQQGASRDNMIVVSQKGLTAGENYSDIYSDHDLGGAGSSFSAATVGALAAKIVEKYPRLPIWQIRMAILASGDLRYSLKVRTASQLNRKRALKAASYLNQLGAGNSIDITLTKLLEKLYNEEEANKRYFLYESRNLFPAL